MAYPKNFQMPYTRPSCASCMFGWNESNPISDYEIDFTDSSMITYNIFTLDEIMFIMSNIGRIRLLTSGTDFCIADYHNGTASLFNQQSDLDYDRSSLPNVYAIERFGEPAPGDIFVNYYDNGLAFVEYRNRWDFNHAIYRYKELSTGDIYYGFNNYFAQPTFGVSATATYEDFFYPLMSLSVVHIFSGKRPAYIEEESIDGVFYKIINHKRSFLIPNSDHITSGGIYLDINLGSQVSIPPYSGASFSNLYVSANDNVTEATVDYSAPSPSLIYYFMHTHIGLNSLQIETLPPNT